MFVMSYSKDFSHLEDTVKTCLGDGYGVSIGTNNDNFEVYVTPADGLSSEELEKIEEDVRRAINPGAYCDSHRLEEFYRVRIRAP